MKPIHLIFHFIVFIFYLLQIHTHVYYMEFDRCLENIDCQKNKNKIEKEEENNDCLCGNILVVNSANRRGHFG